jgi:hypothetical protein
MAEYRREVQDKSPESAKKSTKKKTISKKSE